MRPASLDFADLLYSIYSIILYDTLDRLLNASKALLSRQRSIVSMFALYEEQMDIDYSS